MDPDTALRSLRQAIRDLRSAAEGDSNDREIEAGHDVADAAEALDQWITGGGYLPTGWNKVRRDDDGCPHLSQRWENDMLVCNSCADIVSVHPEGAPQ